MSLFHCFFCQSYVFQVRIAIVCFQTLLEFEYLCCPLKKPQRTSMFLVIQHQTHIDAKHTSTLLDSLVILSWRFLFVFINTVIVILYIAHTPAKQKQRARV